MEPLDLIESATVCEAVFGVLSGNPEDARKLLAIRYRKHGRAVHPDRHAHARRAHDAFVKLTQLKDEAERKIEAGTYGDRKPPSSVVHITAGRRTYRVGDILFGGDVCDLRACWLTSNCPSGCRPRSTAELRDERALFKMARSAGDDDLVENEGKVLGALYPRDAKDAKFRRYLPRLVDTFNARIDGTPRRANVLASFGGHVSVAAVKAVYPGGLDFRDVVWMWKRLLVGLGWVHRQGFVHGAIVPPHVLVHPIDHGARLVDWCYAVPTGERVRARVKDWADLYAPEIARREPATPATDLFMAARLAGWLLDANAPRPFTTFLETCLAPSPRRRPDDAWKLHDELEALLCKLVGPPKYRPLVMPPTA